MMFRYILAANKRKAVRTVLRKNGWGNWFSLAVDMSQKSGSEQGARSGFLP